MDRLVRSVVVVGLGALAAWGCRPKEPIRIGLVSGLSGRHYDLGISSRNGVQLAVAELNAAGGIGGRPVELLVRDDRQDPETARAAVEDLIRNGVVAIIGHATSSMAEATLPIVDRERVLMVSPTVSSSAFRGKDDWFVMLHPSTAESAARMADWLARHGAPRRIAAIYDLSNLAYSRSWTDHFTLEEERRGAAVTPVPFTSGQVPQWSALAAQALAARPDAVLIVANALDSAALAQQLRKAQPGVRLLGTEWGFTHDVLAQGGAAVEGAVFIQKVDVTSTVPAYVRFRQAYEARFKRPVDFAAILSYEAAQLLGVALARDATRDGVRRAVLSAGTFHGLQADYSIDAFGDSRRPHHVMTVRGGAMVRLE
jgi:branched-chain amino acid transport system substrate-binding protein